MLVEKYRELPDGIEQHEATAHFLSLLTEAETEQYDTNDVLEAMCEMSDRQWHTYTIIPLSVRHRIVEWITKHWVDDSLDFVKMTALIAGCLGLDEIVRLFEQTLEHPSLAIAVRKELASAIAELTPIGSDPYKGMPKAK